MRILTTAIVTVFLLTQALTAQQAQGNEHEAFVTGKHKLDDLLFKTYDELAEFEHAHSAGRTPASELQKRQEQVNSLLKEAAQQLQALTQTLRNGLKRKTIGTYAEAVMRRILADRLNEINKLSKRNAAIELKEPKVDEADEDSVEAASDEPNISGIWKGSDGKDYRFAHDDMNIEMRVPWSETRRNMVFRGTFNDSTKFEITARVVSVDQISASFPLPVRKEALRRHPDVEYIYAVEYESENKLLLTKIHHSITRNGNTFKRINFRSSSETITLTRPDVDVAVRDIIANGRKGLLTVRYGNVGRGSVPPTRLRIEVGRRLYDPEKKAIALVWEELVTEPIAGLAPWEHRFFNGIIPRDVVRIRATVDADSAIVERDEKNNVREEEVEDRGKLAVVVLGNIDLGNTATELGWEGKAQKAALEALNDLKRAGYRTKLFLLNETPFKPAVKKMRALYQYIANPDLKVFVFIGHGSVNFPEEATEEERERLVNATPALLIARENAEGTSRAITPNMIARYRGGATMRIVLLHGCNMGAFAKKWREAFSIEDDGLFVAPAGLTSPTAILNQLREWEVPEGMRVR